MNRQSFNTTKFQLLLTGKNPIKEKISIKDNTGKEIVPNEVIKDLGLKLDRDGSFTTHINEMVSKIRKQM